MPNHWRPIAGRVFVGTLEDGLVVKTAQGWQHVTPPTLSSNAPRQMAVFRDALYVRNGGGQVDRLDGTTWTRNVCAGLPRKEVSALAADATTLYAAQWGGWSEWDGAHWTHHLRLPELQGVPITALCPDGKTLWIGTQGRGVLAFDRETGQVRRLDAGIPDDWVTCLAHVKDTLYAGTFVGGLALLGRDALDGGPGDGRRRTSRHWSRTARAACSSPRARACGVKARTASARHSTNNTPCLTRRRKVSAPSPAASGSEHAPGCTFYSRDQSLFCVI